MKSTASRLILGGILAIIVLIGTCSAGFIVGQAFGADGRSPLSVVPELTASTPNASGNGSDSQGVGQLFKPFWQAWDLIHQQYVDQPVDDETLMRGAIQGMMDALGDEHTSYMDPQTQEAIDTQLMGHYEGIGAVVDTTTEYLTIVSTYPGTPAEEAGLNPGDQVIAVDGEDMTGIEGELVRRKIIGPADTQVTLTIRREGAEQPFDVTITRAEIEIPAIESKMLPGQVAYVRVNYPFGENTSKDLEAALKELMDQDPVGVVLDLRDNGGGYLHVAIEVASQFIEKGVIVYEQYGDGTRETFEARRGGLATDIPLVVLVNEGSASASEIVAGAIQDTGRGKLVGVTSFGKGSVQIVTDLVDKQGAVRITVARWLTPKERTIHEVGLKPDVEVERTPEDIQAGRDPQLDKAVELLTQP